jgi:histidinol-phosphatase (PHP family)
MHTHYCDGGAEPVKYVQEAIRQKLTSLGFSAHAPVHFETNWAMPINKFNNYVDEINALKNEFQSQLQIYLGLEIDYFPDNISFTRDILNASTFDYFIGSVHFVDFYPDGRRWTIDGSNEEFRKGFKEIFKNDAIEVTRKFFEYNRKMITDLHPPVIGHIDKLKMQHRDDCFIAEDHPVFREELLKTLAVAQQAGSIVEINTRGIYKKRGDTFYPGQDVFKEMNNIGVKVIVNSDAHLPHEITGEFDKAFFALHNAGYKYHYMLIDNEFKQVEIPGK